MARADEDEIRYLTGLRGYAALAVFIVHVIGTLAGHAMPLWAKHAIASGQNGVLVFFVLSGFTICLSLDRRPTSFGPYMVRRLFRIAPLYYAVCIALFLAGHQSYWASALETPFDFKSLLLHLSFLTAFDHRHANNATGVEWTLAIEMLFYLFLPLMWRMSKSIPGAAALAAISLGGLLLPPALIGISGQAWSWSPTPYVVSFAAGVLTYRLWRSAPHWMFTACGLASVPVTAILVAAYHPEMPFTYRVLAFTGLSVLLIMGGNTPAGRRIFGNGVAYYLGLISYSLYLVHLPIMDTVMGHVAWWLAIPVIAVLTLVVSSVTYRYIEQPGRDIGRSAASRWGRRMSPITRTP